MLRYFKKLASYSSENKMEPKGCKGKFEVKKCKFLTF